MISRDSRELLSSDSYVLLICCSLEDHRGFCVLLTAASCFICMVFFQL